MVVQRFEQGNQGSSIAEADLTSRLTKRSIERIAEDMDLAEQLVTKVLKDGVDYGQTPGTSGKGLWDPGAAKIFRAFQTHAEHKVIFHEETDENVAWTIEAKIIHNFTGEVVGSGLGCSSTRETKYKYRWVTDPLNYEYDDTDIAELKTRVAPWDGKTIQYRITNPEYGELVNTLLQMASKRAEIDAAKSMPGVGSVLRSFLDPKAQAVQAARVKAGKATEMADLSLPEFWGMIHGMGVNDASAHRALGVNSINDWTAAGHTLREGLILIGKQLADLAKKSGRKEPEPAKAVKSPEQITPVDIPNIDSLLAACKLFWGMEEGEVWTALGYGDRQNFQDVGAQTAFEGFQAILLKRREG